ncbi:hypothetical protein [Carboxylicivirga taeanensis]|uniref:hypothetical protein n=1 Tax=Carboxylicivirga taeanensis TaxID=1416875 RepID=UPI003F6DBC82
MKRYIEQLIEDLESIQLEALERLKRFFWVSEGDEYELVQDEELGGVKLSELIGIEQFCFPNIDYLSDFEVTEVVKTITKVLEAYGLNPIFERCVSDRIKYGHLRIALEQQVFPVKDQLVDLEMCDYLPQHCPFFQMCSLFNAHEVCCVIKRRA